MAVADGPYFIGVDVGTSSVRAALVTSGGHLVGSASCAITIWEPEPNFYEQSSNDIWQACCTVVRVSLCLLWFNDPLILCSHDYLSWFRYRRPSVGKCVRITVAVFFGSRMVFMML